jgi:hypothetical protein
LSVGLGKDQAWQYAKEERENKYYDDEVSDKHSK